MRAKITQAGCIDYFIVSERLLPRVVSSEIRTDVLGSDHCPVVLELSV